MRLLGRIANAVPFAFSPARVLFWSLAILVPIVGLRMAGIDSNAVAIPQLLPTLVLLIGMFAFVDIELSDVVPGANDNASGVAAAVSLAEELSGDAPENLDVWVVLSGGEECLMQGMRSFVRSHRKQLADRPAYFLNLDSVGGGRVRYTASEGLAVSFQMGKRMNQLCEAIATAGQSDNGARPAPAQVGLCQRRGPDPPRPLRGDDDHHRAGRRDRHRQLPHRRRRARRRRRGRGRPRPRVRARARPPARPRRRPERRE